MKLKPEYKNQIIKVKGAAGLITFDTSKTPESDYELLSTLGFDYCFEVKTDKPLKTKSIAYTGIEIDKSIKVDKKKNGKKDKAEGQKG